MSKSTIIYDKFWYNPTSLVDRQGRVTLLGHRYILRKGIHITLTNKIEAFDFDSTPAMVEAIQRKRMRRLPQEADGQPQYVPKRVQTLKQKYEALL